MGVGNTRHCYSLASFIATFCLCSLRPSACRHSVVLIRLQTLMTGCTCIFLYNNLIYWWSSKQPANQMWPDLMPRQSTGMLLSHCSKTSVDGLFYPSYSCLSPLLFFVIIEVLLWNLIYILSENILPKQLIVITISALDQVANNLTKPLTQSPTQGDDYASKHPEFNKGDDRRMKLEYIVSITRGQLSIGLQTVSSD